MCGGLVVNRFGLLVLCFADWLFFPSEVRTKDLLRAFYVEEVMKKEASDFFKTFVGRQIPFTYVPPTGNECGRN